MRRRESERVSESAERVGVSIQQRASFSFSLRLTVSPQPLSLFVSRVRFAHVADVGLSIFRVPLSLSCSIAV
jgi:hypothetical protein